MSSNDTFFIKHIEAVTFDSFDLTKIKISSCFHMKFVNALSWLVDNQSFLRHKYFVLPAYKNKRNLLNDWQTNISGSIKQGESPEHAAQRELLEEIGVYFDPKHLSLINVENKKGKRFYHYVVDVDNGSVDRPYEFEFEDTRYDCPDKVFIWLFTNNPYHDNIRMRRRMLSDDNAGEVLVILPFGFVHRVIYLMSKHQFKPCGKWALEYNHEVVRNL